jgi:hypothetical protein
LRQFRDTIGHAVACHYPLESEGLHE